MRLFARGKWIKEKGQWSVVVPLSQREGRERSAGEEERKQPLAKRNVVAFPRRPRRR